MRVNDRGLQAVDVQVRFGGLAAVDGVSVDAPVGRITGLIGPNGAGKTTTFNACTGLNKLTAGCIRVDGEDISSLSPAQRARRGLGRTFQRMELFDDLNVAENIAMGREAGLAGSSLIGQLMSRRTERAAVDAAVTESVERCGLEALVGQAAGPLSTGQRHK